MTPFEFALHGGWKRDNSVLPPVELSVDRCNRDYPVQLSMYPWQRTPENDHIEGITGFLTPEQIDTLIEVLTTLRERVKP